MRRVAVKILTGLLMMQMAIGLAAQNADSRPSITVRLYDFGSVDRRVLTRAEAILGDIYKEVGIEVHWVEACKTMSDKTLDCSSNTVERREIWVSIMRNSHFGSGIAGYRWSGRALAVAARPNEDSPGEIKLLYDRAEVIADTVLSNWMTDRKEARGIVLAYLLAHEVGHLLLPDGRHSTRGIMMAEMTDREWQLAAKGILGFERQQGALMREGAIKRAMLSGGDN